MPETSIVIRAYNEEKHLGNLLRAIGKQKYQNYEIIVVDSGSTDRTREIAQEFNVKLVSIESRETRRAHSGWNNTNNIFGFSHSEGKYIIYPGICPSMPEPAF